MLQYPRRNCPTEPRQGCNYVQTLSIRKSTGYANSQAVSRAARLLHLAMHVANLPLPRHLGPEPPGYVFDTLLGCPAPHTGCSRPSYCNQKGRKKENCFEITMSCSAGSIHIHSNGTLASPQLQPHTQTTISGQRLAGRTDQAA